MRGIRFVVAAGVLLLVSCSPVSTPSASVVTSEVATSPEVATTPEAADRWVNVSGVGCASRHPAGCTGR